MVKEIVKDTMLLSAPSKEATAADAAVGQDLLDTLKAHSDRCVGMAANMIGVLKRVIAISAGGEYMVMYNPEIVKKDGAFEAREGCLSLTGIRPAKRYKTIKVKYQTADMKVRMKTFTGFAAQTIQHELDHCEGILI